MILIVCDEKEEDRAWRRIFFEGDSRLYVIINWKPLAEVSECYTHWTSQMLGRTVNRSKVLSEVAAIEAVKGLRYLVNNRLIKEIVGKNNERFVTLTCQKMFEELREII